MTLPEKLLAYRFIELTHRELDSIRSAIQDKDLAFARIIFARVETDLAVLKDLIQREEEE